MHLLHKAIASRAKARITALKQSLELNMSLVVSGTRILIYMASGDPGVPGRNLIDSRRIAKATVTVVKNLKRKGKCDKSSGNRKYIDLAITIDVTQLSGLPQSRDCEICTFVRINLVVQR